MPTVYVASALENWRRVQKFQDQLRQRGLSIPHDWASIYEQELFEEGYVPPKDLSGTQVLMASSCDCLVLLTPAKRGAHVEYGVALGSENVCTVLVVPLGDKVIGFYHLADRIVDTDEKALEAVCELLGVAA